MKTETSSIELGFIIKELQFLVGSKVDKIYQDGKTLLLQLHTPSKGKQLLNIIAPNYFYLSSKKQEFPQTPSGFCMFLRKYLENTRVRSISQIKFERIIEIDFEGKFNGIESHHKMIIELFSLGNIVLCKDDYLIMSALENKNWSERHVRGGVKYEFPSRQNNILEINESDFEKTIKESNTESIVKKLAIDFSFGGIYAEEILSNLDIDKNKKDLNHEEFKKIFSSVKKILKKELTPITINENEAYPFILDSLTKKEYKTHETFNQAIDSIITPKLMLKKEKEVKSKHDKKIEKVKDIIKCQEKQIKELQKTYDENTKKGELIYHNYAIVKDVLESIKKAKEKQSYKDIKEKLKGHKIVKDIDEKEQNVTIELDE